MTHYISPVNYEAMLHEKDDLIAELLEALEYALAMILSLPNADEFGLHPIQEAIRKARGE